MELSPFLVVSVPYVTAFLAGLFGGVHCVGMCGGVSGVLVYGIPAEQRARHGLFAYVLNYNLGRLLTYTLLGVMVGFIGAQGGALISQYQGWMWLRVLAGLLMVLMGLYLASWWNVLVILERFGGAMLWSRLKPVGQRLLPVKKPRQSFALGLVWGLLPCGLIYTMLVWSLASGGWWQGGAFLLSFGLGTLPVMLLVGLISGQASGKTIQLLQHPQWRRLAGLVVVLFGLWTVLSSILGQINIGLGCLPPG